MRLYGLYKQATEGDVEGIMARPEGHTLEDEGAKKKWDAWKREQGLLRTEAKRLYIAYLIETMRSYASGTAEARELLAELEYLWDSIKDAPYDDNGSVLGSIVGSSINPYRAPTLPGSERSTGTPWPLQSNYSLHQYRSNLEQIYSHLRRNTQLLLDHARNPLVHLAREPASLEDFRLWQREINLVINKLSKEYMGRSPGPEPTPHWRERALAVLRRAAFTALHVAKNVLVTALAMLFLVWCIKRNVKVERTVVTQQLRGKQRRELVVNMVVPDLNRWFMRLLAVINSFVGFV